MTLPYEVEFTDREACGAEIQSIRFTRPEGYAFRAGQWLRLALETPEGEIAKTFTISSAPLDSYLEITTRMSGSPYKNALATLAKGESFRISAPGGRLMLDSRVRRYTFLVGGVGITPVRAMLRDARGTRRVFEDALLMYGNRDDSCVPFRDELLGMEDLGVRTVLVFETPPPGWIGERGLITAEMVERHLDSTSRRSPFLVAGPPAMVTAMEKVLHDLGVPGDQRVIERFTASG